MGLAGPVILLCIEDIRYILEYAFKIKTVT